MVLPSPVGESVAANFLQRAPGLLAFASDEAGGFLRRRQCPQAASAVRGYTPALSESGRRLLGHVRLGCGGFE
jgi:hypothetical protein